MMATAANDTARKEDGFGGQRILTFQFKKERKSYEKLTVFTALAVMSGSLMAAPAPEGRVHQGGHGMEAGQQHRAEKTKPHAAQGQEHRSAPQKKAKKKPAGQKKQQGAKKDKQRYSEHR